MRVRARERGVLGLVRIPLGVWVIRRQFRAHYAVLARGYFLAARETFRVLLEQGRGGSIVFVASKNALVFS